LRKGCLLCVLIAAGWPQARVVEGCLLLVWILLLHELLKEFACLHILEPGQSWDICGAWLRGVLGCQLCALCINFLFHDLARDPFLYMLSG